MNRSLQQVRRRYRLGGFAPAACCAVFVALWIMSRFSGATVDRGQAEVQVARVRNAIAIIPFRLGSWVGQDRELPASALEILHSSAAISRSYSNLVDGEEVSLSIVFCGDVRDMLGHHPPSCYPSAGWQFGPDRGHTLSLHIGTHTIQANLFRFQSVTAEGIERQISILGFFALPGVGFTHDVQVVGAQSARRALSSQGSGQIQVLMDGWVDEARLKKVAEELLGALPSETFEILIRVPADTDAAVSLDARSSGSIGAVEKESKDLESKATPTESVKPTTLGSGGDL